MLGGQETLVEQVRKEGRVVWYTAMALEVAEQVAKTFEKTYGIRVELTRSASERIVARVLQETQAGVNNVDVIEISEAGALALLKQKGLLRVYRPKSYEQFPSAFLLDKDGYFHAWRATVAQPVYNTRLVPASTVPKSWKDLTDPRWKDKQLKVHYVSGAGTNVMAALTKIYGWEYYRNLRKNNPVIVQAASQGVNIVASGERAILVEGNYYNTMRLKAKGNPVDVIFPTEGAVLVLSPTGIAQKAPHPNAAMFFLDYMFGEKTQQLLIDKTRLYVPHPNVKYPPDMPPLNQLKTLTVPVDELLKRQDEIKRMFSEIFGL
jgi:iron(III) transport system substrate-binding protein